MEVEIESTRSRNKAVFTIEVQDLHTMMSNQSMITNETKVPSFTEPQCPHGMPVSVATILFDLHIEKLSGGTRMNLLRKLSDFVDINMHNFHMAVGRGHNTAFGFKDVTMVTAGPGNVADSNHPGVVVSWQTGCGVDVSGMYS